MPERTLFECISVGGLTPYPSSTSIPSTLEGARRALLMILVSGASSQLELCMTATLIHVEFEANVDPFFELFDV